MMFPKQDPEYIQCTKTKRNAGMPVLRQFFNVRIGVQMVKSQSIVDIKNENRKAAELPAELQKKKKFCQPVL